VTSAPSAAYAYPRMRVPAAWVNFFASSMLNSDAKREIARCSV
jgi:hypothetical protein